MMQPVSRPGRLRSMAQLHNPIGLNARRGAEGPRREDEAFAPPDGKAPTSAGRGTRGKARNPLFSEGLHALAECFARPQHVLALRFVVELRGKVVDPRRFESLSHFNCRMGRTLRQLPCDGERLVRASCASSQHRQIRPHSTACGAGSRSPVSASAVARAGPRRCGRNHVNPRSGSSPSRLICGM